MSFQDGFNTYEQAVKLFNLGITVSHPYFIHRMSFDGKYDGITIPIVTQEEGELRLPALSVHDIICALPDSNWGVPTQAPPHDTSFTEAKIVVTKFSHGYQVAIMTIYDKEVYAITNHILAHSLCDMLIYILENGLLSVEQVNTALATK